MFSRFIKSILFAIMVASGTYSITAQAQTLQSVIDTYCRKDCVSAEQLTDVSKRAANSFKVDYRAILAIVHIESKYHTKAKNGSSVGLSQVLLYYHRSKFRGKNYFNVEDNIFAGMKVFSDCFKRMKGNYPKAFKCYNGGGDKNYTAKAMKAYSMMKGLDHLDTGSDQLGMFIKRNGYVHTN